MDEQIHRRVQRTRELVTSLVESNPLYADFHPDLRRQTIENLSAELDDLVDEEFIYAISDREGSHLAGLLERLPDDEGGLLEVRRFLYSCVIPHDVITNEVYARFSREYPGVNGIQVRPGPRA
ncbi:hypothetical protein [Rhodococcus rhodochrous]|uniref:hypothetical protein n=1 Tax=Rhodococcus rhodochrous TaxID=1829 RepID=UPI00177F1904|nr:hypothetical protein [Rhodococcus rhodochrous]